MISLRPSALRLDERDFGQRVGGQALVALEQFHGAEDGLQGVVELVRDAGHEQAHGGQALLPDDLALQRLQHLAHLAFLFELPIERLARVAETERHVRERILDLAELEVGRQAHRGRRQVAVGNSPGGVSELRQVADEPPRQPHAEQQQQDTSRRTGSRCSGDRSGRRARTPRCAERPRSGARGRVR